MKKLQNNFTSTEQSKRLLELGVPADSADCYYLREHDDKVYLFQNQKESDNCISKIRLRLGLGHAMPCWSVGRLMEIFAICFDPDFIHFDTYADGINFLQQMMDKYETYAENMDFSKLKEYEE